VKQTLQDIQAKYNDPISVLCDNTKSIIISKNPVIHYKMKHILIKYHFIREHAIEKDINIEYIGTK
jgi:hypothetical protein